MSQQLEEERAHSQNLAQAVFSSASRLLPQQMEGQQELVERPAKLPAIPLSSQSQSSGTQFPSIPFATSSSSAAAFSTPPTLNNNLLNGIDPSRYGGRNAAFPPPFRKSMAPPSSTEFFSPASLSIKKMRHEEQAHLQKICANTSILSPIQGQRSSNEDEFSIRAKAYCEILSALPESQVDAFLSSLGPEMEQAIRACFVQQILKDGPSEPAAAAASRSTRQASSAGTAASFPASFSSRPGVLRLPTPGAGALVNEVSSFDRMKEERILDGEISPADEIAMGKLLKPFCRWLRFHSEEPHKAPTSIVLLKSWLALCDRAKNVAVPTVMSIMRTCIEGDFASTLELCGTPCEMLFQQLQWLLSIAGGTAKALRFELPEKKYESWGELAKAVESAIADGMLAHMLSPNGPLSAVTFNELQNPEVTNALTFGYMRPILQHLLSMQPNEVESDRMKNQLIMVIPAPFVGAFINEIGTTPLMQYPGKLRLMSLTFGSHKWSSLPSYSSRAHVSAVVTEPPESFSLNLSEEPPMSEENQALLDALQEDLQESDETDQEDQTLAADLSAAILSAFRTKNRPRRPFSQKNTKSSGSRSDNRRVSTRPSLDAKYVKEGLAPSSVYLASYRWLVSYGKSHPQLPTDPGKFIQDHYHKILTPGSERVTVPKDPDTLVLGLYRAARNDKRALVALNRMKEYATTTKDNDARSGSGKSVAALELTDNNGSSLQPTPSPMEDSSDEARSSVTCSSVVSKASWKMKSPPPSLEDSSKPPSSQSSSKQINSKQLRDKSQVDCSRSVPPLSQTRKPLENSQSTSETTSMLTEAKEIKQNDQCQKTPSILEEAKQIATIRTLDENGKIQSKQFALAETGTRYGPWVSVATDSASQRQTDLSFSTGSLEVTSIPENDFQDLLNHFFVSPLQMSSAKSTSSSSASSSTIFSHSPNLPASSFSTPIMDIRQLQEIKADLQRRIFEAQSEERQSLEREIQALQQQAIALKVLSNNPSVSMGAYQVSLPACSPNSCLPLSSQTSTPMMSASFPTPHLFPNVQLSASCASNQSPIQTNAQSTFSLTPVNIPCAAYPAAMVSRRTVENSQDLSDSQRPSCLPTRSHLGNSHSPSSASYALSTFSCSLKGPPPSAFRPDESMADALLPSNLTTTRVVTEPDRSKSVSEEQDFPFFPRMDSHSTLPSQAKESLDDPFFSRPAFSPLDFPPGLPKESHESTVLTTAMCGPQLP